MKITVTAKAAEITERETLTVGSRGIMLAVSFSHEWDGLSKSALFWDGTESEPIPVLIFSDFILLPPEMTATKALKPSVVFVGKNADGTEVFPAVECPLGNVWYGIRGGKYPPFPPSPDWIAQVEAAVTEAKADSAQAIQTAKSVEDRANSGEFNGKDFSIKKVYTSVADMLADHSNPAVEVGDFVMIETGDPENPENSRMYVKTDETFEFVTDLSGSQGIRGPQGFTFTPHMRKVPNGIEITWTNNGGLENPPAQVVLDYQHSEEFSALAQQVREDARASAESKQSASEYAAAAGRQATAAGGKAAEAAESSKAAAQSVTAASEQVEAAKEQVQAAAGQVTLAKNEVQKASEQVGLAKKEVEKAQNEVKIAQDEVEKATSQADRAKSEADRATEAAENAGRGYTNQVAANALVRTVSGEVIAVDDVSPLEHEVKCTVSGVPDLSKVTVSRYGRNLLKLPYKNQNGDYGGVFVSVDSSGRITIKGTVKTLKTFYLELSSGRRLPGGKYYFTGLKNASYSTFRVRVYATYYDGTTDAVDFHSSTTSYLFSKTFIISYIALQLASGDIDVQIEPMFTYEQQYDFEPAKPMQAITPSPSGIVSGMTSLSPNMTILTDTPGALIEATYNQDLIKVLQAKDKRISALEDLITQKLGGM